MNDTGNISDISLGGGDIFAVLASLVPPLIALANRAKPRVEAASQAMEILPTVAIPTSVAIPLQVEPVRAEPNQPEPAARAELARVESAEPMPAVQALLQPRLPSAYCNGTKRERVEVWPKEDSDREDANPKRARSPEPASEVYPLCEVAAGTVAPFQPRFQFNMLEEEAKMGSTLEKKMSVAEREFVIGTCGERTRLDLSKQGIARTRKLIAAAPRTILECRELMEKAPEIEAFLKWAEMMREMHK